MQLGRHWHNHENLMHINLRNMFQGPPQWYSGWDPNIAGMGSFSVRGNKAPHTTCHSQKKKRKEKYYFDLV